MDDLLSAFHCNRAHKLFAIKIITIFLAGIHAPMSWKSQIRRSLQLVRLVGGLSRHNPANCTSFGNSALLAVQAEPSILATVLSSSFSTLPLPGSSAALAKAALSIVSELHDLAGLFFCPRMKLYKTLAGHLDKKSLEALRLLAENNRCVSPMKRLV